MRRADTTATEATTTREARLTLSVALIAMAALAYQVLLMRWLAIAHWQPFAAMIISLALLGHGASGTALSLLRERALARFEVLYPLCAAAFGLSAMGCVALARLVPFNGLELVWNLRQLGWLAALYLCLALPFFCAAACFGLAFARFGTRIPRLYGADLLGAGVGALLALGLLRLGPLAWGVTSVAALAFAASALMWGPSFRGVRSIAVLGACVLIAALVLSSGALTPPRNEYKGLSKNLLLPGSAVIAERHSPQAWLALVESPQVPLRFAPGLSLSNLDEPPPQLGVFADGDTLGALTRRDDAAALAYLGRMTSALPYRLRPRARALVLGAAAGQDVLQALALGARAVDAVEPNPQLLRLVRDDYADFAGGLYADPRVRVRVGDARSMLRAGRTAPGYDLIVWPLADSFGGAVTGAYAAEENYAYTLQALRDGLAGLAPGGLLVLSRWEKLPPRDSLKLFATAVAALEAGGVTDPGARLMALRSWSTDTLLVSNRPFSETDIAQLRAFADEFGFDPVHYPGMTAAEANRYNQLARAYGFEGARALLSPRRDAYLDEYKFAIAPASDDRPYFGHFFRWRALPELWRLRAQGGAILLDSGYLLLLAALAQALPLAVLLILWPLRALPRAPMAVRGRWRPALYFLCLGLAFLLIEIACLARLKLLIGQPLPAIAVGLAGFLVCAGAGSSVAQRWAQATPATLTAYSRRAVFAIGLGLAWHSTAFAAALAFGAELATPARAALGLLTITPLAFAMGLPFPLGLTRLARTVPEFVPWAWGINGCASVLAAMLALLLAIDFGLTATLLAALALYALAAACWPERAPVPDAAAEAVAVR